MPARKMPAQGLLMIARAFLLRADPDRGRAIPSMDSPYEQTTLGELAH